MITDCPQETIITQFAISNTCKSILTLQTFRWLRGTFDRPSTFFQESYAFVPAIVFAESPPWKMADIRGQRLSQQSAAERITRNTR